MDKTHSVMQSHSFLLRLWQTTDARGAIVWRASLQRPDDSKRVGFADLDALFAFLAAQCETVTQDNTDGENPL